MNPKKKNTRDVNDEVEELLRAAQDATLLKLNLNSHTVHASPSDLNPELNQRFRALKSGSKPKAKQESTTSEILLESVKEKKEVEEDDLLARFEALKASLPKPSQIASSSIMGIGESDGKVDIDDDEDDEVEKVIRWAMDAARLDPSPYSGDDNDHVDDDGDDDNDDDDDDDDDDETSDAEDAKTPQGKPKGHHK